MATKPLTKPQQRIVDAMREHGARISFELSTGRNPYSNKVHSDFECYVEGTDISIRRVTFDALIAKGAIVISNSTGTMRPGNTWGHAALAED